VGSRRPTRSARDSRWFDDPERLRLGIVDATGKEARVGLTGVQAMKEPACADLILLRASALRRAEV
jgi:hypothetical protein